MTCRGCIHQDVCDLFTNDCVDEDYAEKCGDYISEERLDHLEQFAQFVAKEVIDDDFNNNSDCFAELVCRRLVKIGYAELEGDTYKVIQKLPHSTANEVATLERIAMGDENSN